MNSFKIDFASRSDLQEILRLQKESYLSEAKIYQDFTIQPLKQTAAELEEEFSKGIFLKVSQGEKIIGSVRAHESEGICHIGKLIVDPNQQNKGIGTALLDKIESCFQNVRTFELYTGHKSNKNLYLYQKLGYRESYRKTVSSSLILVFLRKELTEFA